MSYSKVRIPGLLAPSVTPGSVVFHGVTPGLRNIVLMGDPVKTAAIISDYYYVMCQNGNVTPGHLQNPDKLLMENKD